MFSVINTGRNEERTTAGGEEGIWRCLSLIKVSGVELLERPWRTESHAPQRCMENIQVDADDYPGGDPQNGQ